MTLSADPTEEVRATSDHLILLGEELLGLEEQKRALPTDHPSFLALSIQVRDLGREIAAVAAREEALAVRIAGSSTPPIADYPVRSELQAFLDDWRATRDRLRLAEPGSAEAIELARSASDLRQRYTHHLERRSG